MRIAHLSDLHYGDADTLAEVDRCTGAAVDAAIERGAQLAVISGDATDHALDLHAPAVLALARQVRRLAGHCPVLMLQGTYSHEPPGTLAPFALLGGRHPVVVADRIAQWAWCGDAGWRCSEGWRFAQVPADARLLLSAIPTVDKARVAAAVGAERAAVAVGEQLGALLAGYRASHEAARAAGVPTLGVSHGTVSGCVSEQGVPMAGLDHEFALAALFDAGASGFALGHIHRHQRWQQAGRVVAYAGSVARLHYGEQGTKGWLLWRIGADGADCELVPTPARRMLSFEFDGPPELARLQAAAAEIAGAHVRVRWQVPQEQRDQVDRAAIAAALAGAAAYKLEARLLPLQRARCAGIHGSARLGDQLAHWARLNGVDAGPLCERLERLEQGGDAEAVLQQLLRHADAAPTGQAGAPLPALAHSAGAAA